MDNSSHFSATFYVIRESTSFTRIPERSGNAARSRSKHKHASGSQVNRVFNPGRGFLHLAALPLLAASPGRDRSYRCHLAGTRAKLHGLVVP